MGRLLRWCVASTVTIAVFVASTWVGGAVVLPHLMRSSDARWAVAASFGVAVAALAGAWGVWFATRDTAAAHLEGKTVAASGSGSIAAGGDISGTASTGGRKAVPPRPAIRKDARDHVAGRRQVTASANNSIAAGGDISGSASTGGDTESSPP
jgi:hypothetical protein